MKKIVFLVLHLGYGGVEKAVINQANILSKAYQVEIVSLYKLYDVPPFPLNAEIAVRYLLNEGPNKEAFKQAVRAKSLPSIMREGIKSVGILRKRKALMAKAIKACDADIIISTRILFNSLLARYASPNTVTMAEEHCYHNDNEKYISKLLRSVVKLNYFLPVSQGLTDFYRERLTGTSVDCRYIPHNLDSWPDTVSSLSEPALAAVGRLSPEKGFPDMIDIFYRISSQYSDWKLHIIGDGDDRQAIERKIQQYHLQERVLMHGFQNSASVHELLSHSSLYLMTSFEESFGLVLIEAQSHGLPCIAFDSAKGATEIIEDKVNGRLIQGRDKSAYVQAVEELMRDSEIRREFGAKSRLNAEQYSEERVSQIWMSFLETVQKRIE